MRAIPRARLLTVAAVAAATAAVGLPFTAAANALGAAPSAQIVSSPVAVTPGADDSDSQPQVQFFVTGQRITVKHRTLTFDTSKLPVGATLSTSSIGIDPGWQCTTAPNKLSCANPTNVTVAPDARTGQADLGDIEFVVSADASAPFATGSMTVTVAGTGITTSHATIPVSVAQQVKFTGGPNKTFTGPPGSKYTFVPVIKNTGTTTVHGIYLTFGGDYGYDATKSGSNCVYTAANRSAGVCRFNNDLAPGQTYKLATPMQFQISADHEAPFDGGNDFGWFTSTDLPLAIGAGTKGTGTALKLVVQSNGQPAPAITNAALPQTLPGPDDYNSLAPFLAVNTTGKHSPSFTAVGASVTGIKLHGIAKIAVGDLNNGPATAALSRSGDPLAVARITLPAGTVATAVTPTCWPIVKGKSDANEAGAPGFAAYTCFVYVNLAVHAKDLFDFSVKLTSAKATYTGTVKLINGSFPLDDPHATVLSTAKILIDPPAATSPPKSTTPPVAGLPVTGNSAGLFAGAGGLLVLLGAALVWFGRQRRRARHAA